MRTCAPLFRISEAAGRIDLKVGMWLETHWISVLQRDPLAKRFTEVNGRVHVHVRTPFPCLGNSWTDCADNWCVVRGLLAMHFTQNWSYLLERACDCAHI